MIAALLLAAAGPAMTAIEAERAFIADARKLGQWTAFRKWAAADAMMFVPQPTRAHEFLKGRADPEKPVIWEPSVSFTSCDGRLAATYGPWRRPDGSEGTFFTIWQRQSAGGAGSWRWTFDAGKRWPKALPFGRKPIERRASCAAVPSGAKPQELLPKTWGPTRGTQHGAGMSPDRTLAWSWSYAKDKGTWLNVAMWNGTEYRTVMDVDAADP